MVADGRLGWTRRDGMAVGPPIVQRMVGGRLGEEGALFPAQLESRRMPSPCEGALGENLDEHRQA